MPSDPSTTVVYRLGQAFAAVVVVCAIVLAVAATIKGLQWLLG